MHLHRPQLKPSRLCIQAKDEAYVLKSVGVSSFHNSHQEWDHHLHHNENNQMKDIQTLQNTWSIMPALPKDHLIHHHVHHYHIYQNPLRYSWNHVVCTIVYQPCHLNIKPSIFMLLQIFDGICLCHKHKPLFTI